MDNFLLEIVLSLFIALMLALSVTLYSRRKTFAIPRGAAVYGDLKSEGKILHSARFGLSGKPDKVIQRGRQLIPYEYKSTNSDSPRPGHMLQMAAYFLILEEAYPGVVIKYGVLKYRNYAFRIENSPQLKERLLSTVRQMRRTEGMPERKHDNPRRCISCSFREACSQSLIK